MARKLLEYKGVFLEYTLSKEGSIQSWRSVTSDSKKVSFGFDIKSLVEYINELSNESNIIIVTPAVKTLDWYLQKEFKGRRENAGGRGYSYKNQKIRLRDINFFVPDCDDPTAENMKKAFEPIMTMTNWKEIPVSVHSIVRKDLNDLLLNIKENDNTETQKNKKNYQMNMRCSKMTAHELRILEYSKRGGINLCNEKYIGQTIEDAYCYDVTSQYPTLMVTQEFPQGAPKFWKGLTKKKLLHITQSSAVLLKIRFTYIQTKLNIPYLQPISATKAEYYQGNERLLVYAKEVIVYIWAKELFEIVNDIYEYESMEILEALEYQKGMLQKPFRRAILEYFGTKTQLKGVDGEESKKHYAADKIKLNALAGNLQMSPVDVDELAEKCGIQKGNYNRYLDGFTDEQIQNALDSDYNKITKETKYFRRYGGYPQGCYLTMLGRVQLMRHIIDNINDFLYSDTDSGYFKKSKHQYFDIENKDFYVMTIIPVAQKLGVEVKQFIPSNIKGEPKMLGEFEEEHYHRFKMLGIKRYLLQKDSGEIILKHSGLLKTSAEKLLQEANETGKDVFDVYTEEFKGYRAPTRIFHPESLDTGEKQYVTYEVVSSLLEGLALKLSG